MNWTPDDLEEYGLRQKLDAARLDQLAARIKAHPTKNGRPPAADREAKHTRDHVQRRLAYLRRAGRNEEADREQAAAETKQLRIAAQQQHAASISRERAE